MNFSNFIWQLWLSLSNLRTWNVRSDFKRLEKYKVILKGLYLKRKLVIMYVLLFVFQILHNCRISCHLLIFRFVEGLKQSQFVFLGCSHCSWKVGNRSHNFSFLYIDFKSLYACWTRKWQGIRYSLVYSWQILIYKISEYLSNIIIYTGLETPSAYDKGDTINACNDKCLNMWG